MNSTPKPPNRNDPCFCGSGLKYKKCCLNKIETKFQIIRRLRDEDEALGQRLLQEYMTTNNG